jgi:hypothetical protein
MKTFLPWLVAAIAIGGGWYFYHSGQSQSAENRALQEQVAEVDHLRAELEALKQEHVSAEELERLRQNSRELLQLRNEIGQLRNQKAAAEQQARQARTQVEQAQAVAQAAQSEMQALSQQQAQAQAAANAMTVEQQLFAARYGLDAEGVQLAMACINQLRQIEGAKQQWALENGQPATATPTEEQIAPYLKDGIPPCPGGGDYSLNSVGEVPTCNQPGHVVTE